jgi:ribosomal protein S18 acetylase RimI-like enzyme
MAESVRIRSAVQGDAVRIAELSGVLGYPISVEAATARLQRLLTNPENAVFVAELASAGVVGWIHGAEQLLVESGRHFEILGLVVAANQRRYGIGRRLVAELERWAGERGLEQLCVRSNVIRAESHPFYERLGYIRAKTQHVYRKQISAQRR